MSKRNRNNDITVGLAAALVVVVLFVSWIAVLGYRREHADERDKIPTSEAHQDGGKIFIDCVGIGSSKQHCSAVLPPSETADAAAKYDLRAQQEMAEWALGMFIATAVGLVVSAITLWALFVNLNLQRKATRHALSAARAGWKAADLTKSQMIAYVHAPAARLTKIESRSALIGEGPKLELQVANVGQTAATNVRVEFEIRSQKVNDITGWHPFQANKINRELSNIPPDEVQWFELMPTVAPHLAVMASHREHFVLRGEVFYDDVLANGYKSRFMFFFIILQDRNFGPLEAIPLPASTFDLIWPADDEVDEEALAAHNRTKP